MKLNQLTLLAVCGQTLMACTPSAPQKEQLASVASWRPDVLSPGTQALRTCTGQTYPDRAIVIELTDPTLDSMKNLGVQVYEVPAMGGESPTLDFGHKEDAQPWPGHIGTKLDLNLALTDPKGIKKGSRNRIYVAIKIDDNTARFIDTKFAITSLDSNGPKMFCKRDGYFDDKHIVYMEAEYYSNPNASSDKKTHGTFNINIVIYDNDKSHIVPITLDPEVKNEG